MWLERFFEHANFKISDDYKTSDESRLAKAAKRRAHANGEDEDADDESDMKLGRSGSGHPAAGWP